DGVHVLVVDDDEDAREAVTAVLESCGAEVVGAAGAAVALESLRRARPDVIVSDIAMPAMDGHQLIRCIRTLDAERGGRTPAAARRAASSAWWAASACSGGCSAGAPSRASFRRPAR